MKTTQVPVLIFLASLALLSGCATNTYSRPDQSSSYRSSAVYGVINAIDIAHESSSQGGIGAGAIIGGVVGGVLGHQVGGGTGKDVATVAGAVGGAMVGHQIEKNNQQQQQDVYRIQVQLDRGGYQTVTQQSMNDLRVGDRVRIENDQVTRH